MFAIIDIILRSGVDYLNYIRRKTGFLLNAHNPALIQWLWQHIIRDSNFDTIPQQLTQEEQQAFFLLIENFGYLPAEKCDDRIYNLEKQFSWLFKHPSGGVFVPLEFFKILMPKMELFEKNFLFSLLFRLREKEQSNYISLLGDYAREQLSYMTENSFSDTSLLLYIWMANYHRQNSRPKSENPKQARIVPFPFQSQIHNRRQMRQQLRMAPDLQGLKEIFTAEPKPLWDHLSHHFRNLEKEIDELHYIMSTGKKSFYRALSLIGGDSFSALLYMFRFGYFVPIFPNRYFQVNQINEIKLVTPVEIMKIIQLP